jgi:hypothetical protein
MGVTFLPSVAIARKVLGMRFGMGATMALRRDDLERLGGFSAIVDYLADDFQLAIRIARLGRRLELSRYIVSSVLGSTTFRAQWHREVRWARCQRVCRPREYPTMLLTFTTPLAACLLIASGFSPVGWGVLAGSLAWRWVIAWLVTCLTADGESRRWLALLPLRDFQQHRVAGGRVWSVRRLAGRQIPAAARRPHAACFWHVATAFGSGPCPLMRGQVHGSLQATVVLLPLPLAGRSGHGRTHHRPPGCTGQTGSTRLVTPGGSPGTAQQCSGLSPPPLPWGSHRRPC